MKANQRTNDKSSINQLDSSQDDVIFMYEIDRPSKKELPKVSKNDIKVKCEVSGDKEANVDKSKLKRLLDSLVTITSDSSNKSDVDENKSPKRPKIQEKSTINENNSPLSSKGESSTFKQIPFKLLDNKKRSNNPLSLLQKSTEIIADIGKNKILYKYSRGNPQIQFESGLLTRGHSDLIVLDEFNHNAQTFSAEQPCVNRLYVSFTSFDYTSDTCEIHLKNTLNEILNYAIRQNCKILTLPALGIERHGYPSTLCVKWMDECMRKYFMVTTIHSLNCVRIILQDKNCEHHFTDYFTRKDLLLIDAAILMATKPNDKYTLENVDFSSEEYEIVSKHFFKSIKERVCLEKIQKIENFFLRTMYNQSKAVLKQRNATYKPLEYNLFHGTSRTSMDSIFKHGFNRSYCGRHATFFGQGVYFARDAHCSHKYVLQGLLEELNALHLIPLHANPFSTYIHLFPQKFTNYSIILCNVLVGEYQLGLPNTRDPDVRADGNQYDSTVNNLKNPDIFVIYRDYRAYPAYVIDYKVSSY